MTVTGWGGVPDGQPDEPTHTFLFLTCDCFDFSRGVVTGIDQIGFERRKTRLDTITVADQDDVDAIEWLWNTHSYALGDMEMLDVLSTKLIFSLSNRAYRKYVVTKTFKPYKRKKGGKTTYHLVIATPEANAPTDFVCKHCMAAALDLHPGNEIVWVHMDLSEISIHLSNLIVLTPIDKRP